MKKTIRKILIILFWIVVWAVLALAVDNKILMATPLQAAGELLSLLGEASFYKTCLMPVLSLTR